MRVSGIELVDYEGRAELRGTVEGGALREPFRLHFQVSTDVAARIPAHNGDPFLAAALLPAMKSGEPLEIDAPVSPRLLRSLEQIQAIYRAWGSRLCEVEVRAPTRAQPDVPSGVGDVGLFFSLGVDSFYTLVADATKQERTGEGIRHLILVDGFDRARRDAGVLELTRANTERVAAAFDKHALVVSTNVWDLSRRFVPWSVLGHGAALAGVGLALQGAIRRVLISSSFGYARMVPWGSHPLLDPLWSTEALSVVHTGCETRRLDKLRAIAPLPIVRETLRVCTDMRNRADRSKYNCGRCDKCLRTAIGLHVVGALSTCGTLPREIDLDLVRDFPMRALVRSTFTQALIDALGSAPEDLAIKSALQDWLGRATGELRGNERAQASQTREAELARRLEALRAKNAALHHDVKALGTRLSALRAKLDRARSRHTTSRRTGLGLPARRFRRAVQLVWHH
jgi:hypothetical protein